MRTDAAVDISSSLYRVSKRYPHHRDRPARAFAEAAGSNLFPLRPPKALRRPHLALIHPEIMSHLVPHGVFHQLRQMLRTLRQPLVRSLEDDNPVGHGEAVENAAAGQRPAFIEAEERALARHRDRNVLQSPAKPRRY